MQATRILLGVIGRPHGVRGLVRVHSYTENPADLAGYGPLWDERGRQWTLAWKGEGIAELRDAAGQAITDRTEAGKLTNTRLYVDRDRLPATADEEWYLADLVGLQAVSTTGAAMGVVSAVHDYGAGVSLEITRAGVSSVVPFTRASVPVVDLAGGRVIVDPPVETEAERAA
jgi:16S rRNA processing protein RimM